MKKILFISFLLTTILTQFAFADSTPWYQKNPCFFNTINNNADTIIEDSQWKLYRYKPILYSSFVNLNNLQETSSFGRLIAELFSTRFAQHGYKVLEIKMRKDNIVVKEKIGELILSRKLADIKNANDAQAILCGTYAKTDKGVYVNARIISTIDQSIVSAESFLLPNARKITPDH